MNQNKTAQASALSDKVGKIIICHNSCKLNKINSGGPSMWDEVRRLTGPPKPNQLPSNLTAHSLNSYYSSISTISTHFVFSIFWLIYVPLHLVLMNFPSGS